MKTDILTPDHAPAVSVKTTVISLAVISSIIGLVMAGAMYANQYRQKMVIDQYTQETDQLIASHQSVAKEFFTQTFDECQKLLPLRPAVSAGYYQDPFVDCPAAASQLSKLEVDQLQDSSAIAYVRVVGDKYELIEASGKYHEASSLEKYQSYNQFSYSDTVRADLVKYFQQQQPILLWQDFIPYIGSKEVVVPVKIEDKIVGYIFRGVIER